MIQTLQELEVQKFDILEEMERIRQKAHSMLREKDVEQRKLKLLISKYHQCLRDHDLTDDQITEFVYLNEEELNLDSDNSESESADNTSSKLHEEQGSEHLNTSLLNVTDPDPQNTADKDTSSVVDKVEYLRNVFLKYLELRYSHSGKRKV